jgi:hypothetical protein
VPDGTAEALAARRLLQFCAPSTIRPHVSCAGRDDLSELSLSLYSAILDKQNIFEVLNCTVPMRDDDHCAPAAKLLEYLHDQTLRLVV